MIRVILASKSCDSFATNVIEFGIGGINVNDCRVDNRQLEKTIPPGRFPANLLHDGSEKIVSMFPEKHLPGLKNPSFQPKGKYDNQKVPIAIGGNRKPFDYGAESNKRTSRFFYRIK